MLEERKHLYVFGPFRLDPAQRLLFRDNQIIPLTPKAVETLLVLVAKRGQLVTKEELLQRVWPDTFVEEGTVARNVSFLRKALGEAADGREYIETHSKRGYRFIAEVREVKREAVTKGETGEESSQAGALPATAGGRRRWIAALAAAGVLLAIGAATFDRFRSSRFSSDRKVMLVVLPFENLSGDPEQEYFSNGLTEEMITQLGRLQPQRLGVLARTSAMQYKGTKKSAAAITGELGVDYILEGSVRREGSRVRISAQLIQGKDQSHLWAEDYDRDLRDILSVQSEVASAIAAQIRLKLTPEQHARSGHAPPVNPEAYEDYLKGRFFWNKRTVEGHQKAIQFFDQAIALDPDYAEAYAGRADAYALLGSWPNSVLPRREAMTRARLSAQKALALDESLADAHTSLGFLKMHYDWDFTGAEKEFLRAIALNPGYATAHHWYAYDLVALGRLEDAVAQARLAQKADPLSVIISRDVGELLLFAGHDDEAIAQSRKTLEMDPNFSHAKWTLAWAYHHKGAEQEFLEELEKVSPRGLYYALVGRPSEARRAVRKIEQDAAKRYGLASFVAVVYASLGDKDRAFLWLERCFQERDGTLILLRVEPSWGPLRSDPRFEQLARRIGLPAKETSKTP